MLNVVRTTSVCCKPSLQTVAWIWIFCKPGTDLISSKLWNSNGFGLWFWVRGWFVPRLKFSAIAGDGHRRWVYGIVHRHMALCQLQRSHGNFVERKGLSQFENWHRNHDCPRWSRYSRIPNVVFAILVIYCRCKLTVGTANQHERFCPDLRRALFYFVLLVSWSWPSLNKNEILSRTFSADPPHPSLRYSV